MGYLVIYNENAGRKQANLEKEIANFFEAAKLEYKVHHLPLDGSFEQLEPNNYTRVLCVGGDGTLKEVANWIIKKKSGTPLAIIPKGTANLVAVSLGIPTQLQKALDTAIYGRAQVVDAGLINNREYFLLATGIGFDAHVIKNTRRADKKAFGILAYVFGVLRSLVSSRRNKVFVKTEGFEASVRAQSIFVSNIERFLKIKIDPQAKINDGYLNVTIFRSLNLRDLVSLIIKLLRGDYQKDWRYSYFMTKKIYLLPLSRRAPIQIDGEITKLAYLDIEVVPNALYVVTNKEL